MSYFIVDIETIPNKKMYKHLPEVKAPSNYKDEEKIQAYIEKSTEEQIPKMALDIDFAEIRAIGTYGDEESRSNIYNLDSPENEKLEWFWEKAKNQTLVGFNILNFDLPILLHRSLQLGIRPSSILKITKYSDDVIDLMDKLYHGGYVTNMNGKRPFSRGLKKVCEIYGIFNPMPDWDGSMVKDMSNEDLCTYLNNDLRLTKQLFEKMQGYYF